MREIGAEIEGFHSMLEASLIAGQLIDLRINEGDQFLLYLRNLPDKVAEFVQLHCGATTVARVCTLAIKETRTVPDEAISTTFHLSQCLKRRGLAYEFANLISFRAHELYTEKLLKHLNVEPPIGFQAATLAQILRADREVFSFMAQEVQDIRPGANDGRPLDASLERALRDYTVAFNLVPFHKFAMREDISQQPRKHGSEPYATQPSSSKGRERASTRVENHLDQMRLHRAIMDALAVTPRIDQYASITTLQVAAKPQLEDPVQRVAMWASAAVVSRCIHLRMRMLLSRMNDYLMQMLLQSNVLMQLCLTCSAGLLAFSASLRQMGFEVIAVDKIAAKSPKVMVTKLDLTQHAAQQLVLEWIRLPQVKTVFVAPPCGTASKARKIQLEGQHDLPQPLRTPEFPDGVDGLTGWNFLRVEQSNILYDYVAEVYMECCRLGKLFACENPNDSLFWQVTPWVERDFQELAVEQILQPCAYWSKRPKWTKLVANFSHIERIDKVCPGDNQHDPWGIHLQGPKRVFATSLEVHYPAQSCVAETIALALQEKGVVLTAHLSLNQTARAFTNLQAGTSKVPTFYLNTKIAL